MKVKIFLEVTAEVVFNNGDALGDILYSLANSEFQLKTHPGIKVEDVFVISVDSGFDI